MTASKSLDDDELTALALSGGLGDQAAKSRFFRSTQIDVWRYALYLVGPARAEELVADARSRAESALSRYSGRTSARAWLLSIARTAAERSMGEDEEIFVLAGILHLPHAVTADIVGCLPGSIASRAARGRASLMPTRRTPPDPTTRCGWLSRFGHPTGMTEVLVPEPAWRRLRPLAPAPPDADHQPGRSPAAARAVLAGITFVIRTGISWHDLPREVAGCSGTTCRRRLKHWRSPHIWPAVERELLTRAAFGSTGLPHRLRGHAVDGPWTRSSMHLKGPKSWV